MKMTTSQAQAAIFGAMMKHNGDRDAAAAELGKSIRTFYRELGRFEMYDILERCGWKRNAGPPRRKASGMVLTLRSGIIRYLKTHTGPLDYGKLTVFLFGIDAPDKRKVVFTEIDALVGLRRVELVEETGAVRVLPDLT